MEKAAFIRIGINRLTLALKISCKFFFRDCYKSLAACVNNVGKKRHMSRRKDEILSRKLGHRRLSCAGKGSLRERIGPEESELKLSETPQVVMGTVLLFVMTLTIFLLTRILSFGEQNNLYSIRTLSFIGNRGAVGSVAAAMADKAAICIRTIQRLFSRRVAIFGENAFGDRESLTLSKRPFVGYLSHRDGQLCSCSDNKNNKTEKFILKRQIISMTFHIQCQKCCCGEAPPSPVMKGVSNARL